MYSAEAITGLKEALGEAILSEHECCGDMTLKVERGNVVKVLSYLKNVLKPGYEVLMDLTAVDYLEPSVGSEVVYWLHNPTNYQRVRVAVFVERGESLPSVVSLWEGADWYERELYDLFGVIVEGHPELKRILMPDDWEGHPLRKDYKLTEEVVEFKHGVEPKVPSEIIHLKKNQKY